MVVPELPQSIGFAGRAQAVPSSALDAKRIAIARDLHAHLAKRPHGARVVVAAGKIVDPAFALGDRRQDHRAMGDRLVARHGNRAAQGQFRRFDPFHRLVRHGICARISYARANSSFQQRALAVTNPAVEPLQILQCSRRASGRARDDSSNKCRARARAGSRRSG